MKPSTLIALFVVSLLLGCGVMFLALVAIGWPPFGEWPWWVGALGGATVGGTARIGWTLDGEVTP